MDAAKVGGQPAGQEPRRFSPLVINLKTSVELVIDIPGQEYPIRLRAVKPGRTSVSVAIDAPRSMEISRSSIDGE